MGDMHHLKKNVRFLKKETLLPSNHLLIFFLFSFILTAGLNAQIKIEERVEIAPEIYNYETDDPILNHIIQLDVQWNQPQYDAAIVGVNVPCQNASAGWQNGGTISLTINNVMAGFYRLQPRFNTPSGVMTHVTYQLFLDGTQVLSGQRDVPGGFSGGSFPYFNIEYTPPLASSFYFNLQSNTSCILIPTAIEISASASCATGYSWYINTEPLNLTFTSGGEYASFYTNGQKIGDSYSGTLSEIQHINVIQDKVYRGSENMYYLVQGDWAGVIKKDSVRLISQIDDVIVADTYGHDSLYSGQQIQVMIYPNNFEGQCSGIFFPYDVTYNAEIISGNQFGNLIGGFPVRRVQVLTGLTHYWGMSAFNYIADSISVDSIETVTIRISTSDPEIPYTDLTLYIKPSPIYAYTVPEVLGADEEADVIIKKRNPDGTLEDFPPNQTFELAVLDGCVNGNFSVNGVIDVYFADALQPIKFVTADSIDTEFDKVLMRIGTDLGGSYRPIGGENGEEEKKRAEYESSIIGANGKTIKELREGFEKMIAEKKAEAEAKTKEGDEPMFPIVPACPPNNPNWQLTYYNFLASVQDECDEDRPAGLTAIDENMYTINQLPNNTNCNVNNEEARLVGGRLMTTINPPKLSDWGLSPRKSVVELRFTFDWSYCIDLLMQSFTKAQFIELEQVDNKYKVYNPIEGTFREINGPGEARKIISAIKEIGSDGRTIPENIEYYPLPRTKKHEFEHIVQYWDEIYYNFFIALYHINKRQPPRNWCKLSEEEKHRIYNSEDEWYRTTLDNAVNETLDYMNDKEQKKLNEASAHAVSYYYLHSVVIPRIKEQFKLP